jgi:hypothetical protein
VTACDWITKHLSLSKKSWSYGTFEPDLKFKTQINLVCVKAKQKLYFMRKGILSNNLDLLLMIYKMYVLPVLMYCSPVWSPQTHDDILKLEKIQKKFTKSLSGYKDLSYKERLTKSNLKSLELSRIFADLIFCYKILHDLVDINKSHFFAFESCDTRTRSHGLKMRAIKPNCNIALFSYGYRVTKIWNNLSPNTVWAPSLNLFKRYLQEENLSDALLLKYDAFI